MRLVNSTVSARATHQIVRPATDRGCGRDVRKHQYGHHEWNVVEGVSQCRLRMLTRSRHRHHPLFVFPLFTLSTLTRLRIFIQHR